MIKISVNNEITEINQELKLSQFLSQFLASFARTTASEENNEFAIALNGSFVPRSQYEKVILSAGDELDIVSPVGGG